MTRPEISAKTLQAVTSLPGEKRFEHFVKVVVDWEQAWGLYQEGWALGEDDEGRRVFPLWPALEYARECASREWAEYSAEEIALDDLVGELLPKLDRDRVLVGVFPTPSDKGVIVEPGLLQQELERESLKYR